MKLIQVWSAKLKVSLRPHRIVVSYPDPSAILYRVRRKGSGNIGVQFLSLHTVVSP